MRSKKRTGLHDAIDFIRMGSRVLFKDDFTKCFKPISPEELNGSGIFYIFSILIRYFLLLPCRILWFIGGSGIFFILFIRAVIKRDDRQMANSFLFYSKVFVTSFGAKIKHHGIKRRLNVPHVFVANHTSFLDFLVLSSHKFAHASVAEAHGGLFGFLFKSILTKNGSLLFKRSDKSDRNKVSAMIKEHVAKNKASMLIFPEGTCVNNKYSVLYQKGAFDLDAVVCPVAIKYRKNLLDPYWNTSNHTFFVHLLYLMSRWKLDVDVYWMEPQRKRHDEAACEFALRVKKEISSVANLKDVIWNGYFKSAPVLKDRELLKEAFIKVYNKHATLENEFIDSLTYLDGNKERDRNWENENDEIIVHQDDENYFYNFNYRRYLDHTLNEYLFLKNNPNELEEWYKSKARTFQTDQLLWLTQPINDDNPTPCTCFKKCRKKEHRNQKKGFDKEEANKEISKFY